MKIVENFNDENYEGKIKDEVYCKIKFIVGKYKDKEYLTLYNKNIIQKNNIQKLNILQNKLKNKINEMNDNMDTLIEKNNILIDKLKNMISNLF